MAEQSPTYIGQVKHVLGSTVTVELDMGLAGVAPIYRGRLQAVGQIGSHVRMPQQLLWMARGWGFQGVWWRTMALRMVRSLCMQATSATFLGLPWATSRS